MYLILDLESTCADDNSIKDEDREIIEIGAVMIEKSSGKVVDQFQSFIKPTVHKKLTDFCTELTTITQKDVDDADGFIDVMEEFTKWFSGYKNFTFASWGSILKLWG